MSSLFNRKKDTLVVFTIMLNTICLASTEENPTTNSKDHCVVRIYLPPVFHVLRPLVSTTIVLSEFSHYGLLISQFGHAHPYRFSAEEARFC